MAYNEQENKEISSMLYSFSMFLLLIDTSTPFFCLSAFVNGSKVKELYIDQGRAHCAVSIVEKFLEDCNQSLEDLSAVAFGLGPGSFTGIRLAALFAEALFYTRGIPLLSFSSLSLYQPQTSGTFYVARYAFMKGIYLQKGTKKDEELSWEEPSLLSTDQIANLPEVPFLTPDAETMKKKIPEMDWIETKPNLDLVYPLIQKKFEAKDFLTPPISPYYLRELS